MLCRNGLECDNPGCRAGGCQGIVGPRAISSARKLLSEIASAWLSRDVPRDIRERIAEELRRG